MFFQVYDERSGKVYFKIGKAPAPEVKTPDELAEARRKIRALNDKSLLEMLEPSSEEGRKLYYSRVGLLQTPFVLLGNLWEFLWGNDVWYSPEGRRVVRIGIRGN